MNKRISHYTPPASRCNNLMLQLAEVFKNTIYKLKFSNIERKTQKSGEKREQRTPK